MTSPSPQMPPTIHRGRSLFPNRVVETSSTEPSLGGRRCWFPRRGRAGDRGLPVELGASGGGVRRKIWAAASPVRQLQSRLATTSTAFSPSGAGRSPAVRSLAWSAPKPSKVARRWRVNPDGRRCARGGGCCGFVVECVFGHRPRPPSKWTATATRVVCGCFLMSPAICGSLHRDRHLGSARRPLSGRRVGGG